MDKNGKLYHGCLVQHARQFLAGKWQMGILWSLRNCALRFNEIKSQLSGISDKILMQELDFFVTRKIIQRTIYQFPVARTEYALTANGQTLIPVTTTDPSATGPSSLLRRGEGQGDEVSAREVRAWPMVTTNHSTDEVQPYSKRKPLS